MPVNGSCRFDIIGVMGGDIGLEAASMSFYVLDMPGIDDPMPLYDDPNVARIEAGVVTFRQDRHTHRRLSLEHVAIQMIQRPTQKVIQGVVLNT